jgi:hypothetical protein
MTQEESDPAGAWIGNHNISSLRSPPIPWQPHWLRSQSPMGQAGLGSLGPSMKVRTSPSTGACARGGLSPDPTSSPTHLPARGPGHGHRPCWDTPGPALFTRPNLHMLISRTSLLPLEPACLGNGWIWLYLYRADVTPSYFQPGCHGNHKASAPVRSSIYNLLTPPSPQPHPKETGA